MKIILRNLTSGSGVVDTMHSKGRHVYRAMIATGQEKKNKDNKLLCPFQRSRRKCKHTRSGRGVVTRSTLTPLKFEMNCWKITKFVIHIDLSKLSRKNFSG